MGYCSWISILLVSTLEIPSSLILHETKASFASVSLGRCEFSPSSRWHLGKCLSIELVLTFPHRFLCIFLYFTHFQSCTCICKFPDPPVPPVHLLNWSALKAVDFPYRRIRDLARGTNPQRPTCTVRHGSIMHIYTKRCSLI